MVINYKRRAKQNSYKCINGTPVKRDFKSIKGIVIHYTGAGGGDTAKNNADYFATANTRYAGAHYFIDRKGICARSVWLSNIAYSVGKMKYEEGPYFGKLSNTNTVSIELCDIDYKDPSEKQLKKLDSMIRYIVHRCPNIKYIVRHYDIVKKECPAPYVEDPKKWKKLHLRLWTVYQAAMKKYHRKDV